MSGKTPAVVVVHENRGLNPYIEDVARRVAKAGYIALAPDGLSSVEVIREMMIKVVSCNSRLIQPN